MSESKWVAEAMEQAQVYASAWSLVGGGFDDGSMLDLATEEKSILRVNLQRQSDLMERMGEALAVVAKSGEFTCFNDAHWDTVNAALSAFQESKQ
jgi:hypothetical protein